MFNYFLILCVPLFKLYIMKCIYFLIPSVPLLKVCIIYFLICCVPQFSVPQIEYLLGGSSKKGSHVYFLLQVFFVILLFDINDFLILPWWPDVTMVQSDITIVVPWQLSTGSKHDYLFWYCPLVGILFEVLRINTTIRTIMGAYWNLRSGSKPQGSGR